MSLARIDYGAMKALVALSNDQLADFIWHYLKDNGAASAQMAKTTQAAVARMQGTSFTHFFLDYDFGMHGGVDFTKFIRLCDGDMAEAPVVMIMPSPDRSKVFAARDAGVNEILGLPLTAKLLQVRLAHMARAPKPFIRAPGYIGPCRRRDQAEIYHGEERRGGSGARRVSAADLA